MGGYSTPAIQVPQYEDPLKRYAEAVSLRSMMQQQQLRNQLAPLEIQKVQRENQLGDIDLQNQLRLQQAFAPANPQDTSAQPAAPGAASPPAPGAAPQQLPPPDLEGLKSKLIAAGPAGLPVAKMFGDLEEQSDKHAAALDTHAKSQNELNVSRTDLLGRAALATKAAVAAGADPQSVISNVGSLLQGDPALIQKIQTDFQKAGPSGFGPLLDQYIANSAAASKESAETTTAQAAMIRATNPTKARALKDSLSPDPNVSGPAKQYLQAEQQYDAQSAASKAQAEIPAEVSKAQAVGNAQIPIDANKAVAVQQATQSLLQGPAKDMAAENYYQTGQLPAGARSPGMISSIINRAAELHPGGNLAANRAAYEANKGSYNNVTKTLDTLDAFSNAAKANIDQFNSLVPKLVDSGVPWLNTPLRLLNKNLIGNQWAPAVDAAREVANREIGRVTSDPKLSGALTDAARNEVKGFNPDNATIPQVKHILDVLQTDMQNVHQGLSQQKQDIGGRLGMSSGASPSQPAQQHTPGGTANLPEGQTGTGSDGKKYIVIGGKWAPQ